MQTFLPLPSFLDSAKCLDYRRLGKQRLEGFQILEALKRGSGGWYNHPATKMWKGYEEALKDYYNTVVREWCNRGYRNTMPTFPVAPDYSLPPWFGNSDFHASHRSNLLRKSKVCYGHFGWLEPDNLPYVWPVL